jgi:hypothetical protein
MTAIKAALFLLPTILRAALLWFRLRNHLAYAAALRQLDERIAFLEGAQRAARAAGDSDAAIRLLYEADDARADRESLSAAYLELAGGPPCPDPSGHLHPGHPGNLAQPPIHGGP